MIDTVSKSAVRAAFHETPSRFHYLKMLTKQDSLLMPMSVHSNGRACLSKGTIILHRHYSALPTLAFRPLILAYNLFLKLYFTSCVFPVSTLQLQQGMRLMWEVFDSRLAAVQSPSTHDAADAEVYPVNKNSAKLLLVRNSSTLQSQIPLLLGIISRH